MFEYGPRAMQHTRTHPATTTLPGSTHIHGTFLPTSENTSDLHLRRLCVDADSSSKETTEAQLGEDKRLNLATSLVHLFPHLICIQGKPPKQQLNLAKTAEWDGKGQIGKRDSRSQHLPESSDGPSFPARPYDHLDVVEVLVTKGPRGVQLCSYACHWCPPLHPFDCVATSASVELSPPSWSLMDIVSKITEITVARASKDSATETLIETCVYEALSP